MDAVLHLVSLLVSFGCAHRFYETGGFRTVSSRVAGSGLSAEAGETAVKHSGGTLI